MLVFEECCVEVVNLIAAQKKLVLNLARLGLLISLNQTSNY
jgi:hypothetical protein